ncbi:MAG: hypothetical protein ACR2QH_17505 [Geminicoccaceae bacterium]
MLARLAVTAATLLLTLTACLPNDPTVGTGPITLSPGSQQNFEAYLEKRSPGYFAVAEDGGGSYYNYCPSGRCYRDSANKVIHECEKNNVGKPCKIYASKGKVVWKTDVAKAN